MKRRRKPTQVDVEKVRKLIAELTAMNHKLAKMRDDYRDKLSEFESISEDLDYATDSFSDGLRNFRSGIEEMSKYL